MRVDPEAVLRCWPVDVDIGDRTYTIPALPARDWMLAVIHLSEDGLAGSIAGVVPGLIPDDDLADAIADGTVSSEECRQAARDAIEAAAGTKWWTAIKLALAAADDRISGELLAGGADPGVQPFGGFLLAAYRTATRNIADVDRARIDSELDAPPTGLGEEAFSQDEINATFAAAMAATSGRR